MSTTDPIEIVSLIRIDVREPNRQVLAEAQSEFLRRIASQREKQNPLARRARRPGRRVRVRSRSIAPALVGLILFAFTGAAIGAVAILDSPTEQNTVVVPDSGSTGTIVNPAKGNRPPVETALTELRSDFSVLASPRSSADELPTPVLKAPYAEDFIDTSAARRVVPDETRAALFVIPVYPGRAPIQGIGVCLLDARGAGSCQATEGVEKGLLIVRAEREPGMTPKESRLTGLVADDVETVVVAYEGGQEVQADVVDNVFAVQRTGKPKTIGLVRTDGILTVQAP